MIGRVRFEGGTAASWIVPEPASIAWSIPAQFDKPDRSRVPSRR